MTLVPFGSYLIKVSFMGEFILETTKIRQCIIAMIAAAPPDESIQKLPTERELCKTFKTSRRTIRTVLQELEDDKCLIRKPHFGTFVNNDYRRLLSHANYNSKDIAIVIGDGRTTFLDTFFMKILSGLYSELCKEDLRSRHILLNVNAEEEFDVLLKSSQLQALVWITPPQRMEKCLKLIGSSKLPLVQIQPFSPEKAEFCVYTDPREDGYLSAKHILKEGHRKVLFTFRGNPLEAGKKKEGVKQAFSEAGIQWNEKNCFQRLELYPGEWLEYVRSKYGDGLRALNVPFGFENCAKEYFEERGGLILSTKPDLREKTGFQIAYPSEMMGKKAGEMICKLLKSPSDNIVPCKVKCSYETSI